MRESFRPPKLTVTPAIVWALLRALGPSEARVPDADMRARLIAANRLHLSSRIAARQQLSVLEQELGHGGAETLQLVLRHQMARGLAVLDLERQCETAANVAQVDVILLKFAALRRLGLATVGLRGTQDLDILVEERNLNRLTAAMTAVGLVMVEKWVPRHHPAVLRASSGVNVEIHTNLPHVRISGQFATVEALREARLLEVPAGAGEHLLVAGRELLTAHLVAHALVTHAYAPDAYPPLRILCDAIDMDLAHEPALLERAQRWIATDVPERELYSLAELAAACAIGRVEETLDGGSGATVLLRHFLASTLDSSYRRRLRVTRLAQLMREEGPLETTFHLGRAAMRNMGVLVRRRRPQ